MVVASSPPPIRLPRAEEPEVSILILLDGSAAMAERCLRAVAQAHDPSIPCETVLVLNRPSRELEAVVRDGTEGARIVVARANAGPAVGWNLATDLARAPRLAVLHEDSEPDAGWLAPLLKTMAHRAAGVVGSRLFHHDATLQSCGWVLFADGSPLVLDRRSAPEFAAASEPTLADMVSGAAMLIDRETLRAAGGFDERFHPAIFTDIDICVSCWRQGRPVLSVPTSTVRHVSGALEHRKNPVLTGNRLRQFLYERNRDRFLAKWGATVRGGAPPPAADTPKAIQVAVAAALDCLRDRAKRPRGAAPAASRAFTHDVRLVQHDDGAYGLPSELEARLDVAEDEVIRDYCVWLAQRDTEAQGELAKLRACLSGTEHELASVRARVTELEREHHDVAGQLAAARQQAGADVEELIALRSDAHTLQLILNGRWWRLRGLIHGAARRAAGRRRSGTAHGEPRLGRRRSQTAPRRRP